jgi:hypothetical protein
MNKQTKITLSKTLKLPIEGVQYSNKQLSVTIDYDPQEFNMTEAMEEINQMLTIMKPDDPAWISQGKDNSDKVQQQIEFAKQLNKNTK